MKRLYVVEFSSGIVKAGITCNFGNRAKALKQMYGRIVKSEVSGEVIGRAAESALLQRLCTIGVRRAQTEAFDGVKFAVASQLMRQVCERRMAAKGLSTNMKKQPETAALKDSSGIRFSCGLHIFVEGGKLFIKPSNVDDPVHIDVKQLQRWIARQLRASI